MSVSDATHQIWFLPWLQLGAGLLLACSNRTIHLGGILVFTTPLTLLAVFLLDLHVLSGGTWP